MKSQPVQKCVLAALAWLLVIAPAAPAGPAPAADKLKAEDVVAKHLEAVGPAAARAAIKNRIAVGTVVAIFRTPALGQVGGRAVVASEGEKYAVGMVFDGVTNYPHDKVGFDGKDVSTSYLLPGRRSTLGELFMTNKSLVKQGLVGGTLSQAWPLFDLEAKKPKLEYSGQKKVGDRPAHALKYLPRGGSDMNITLFFDAETFQHVRTEYTRTLAAQMGTSPDASARQRESRYKVVEDYSDFRKEGELTLPHKYKITLEINLPASSYRQEWDMTFERFGFNQDIDPKSFDVDDQPGR